MGYMHIANLYRPEAQTVLLFKELWAMEKIHGTSAHVAWSNGQLRFFAGGCSQQAFESIFVDKEALTKHFAECGHYSMTVYGEAYGGKMQGMSKTYGPVLKFVAFDVQIGDLWLNVETAAQLCAGFGFEFVHYSRIPATLEAIDAERDAPSIQAVRNGISDTCIREGIVLRPLIELRDNRGERVIAKHKRAEFAERKTVPNVDPTVREIMDKAEVIAEEFVTDMRLAHVLDKIGNPTEFTFIPQVVAAMVEDVTREASGEIIDNKAVRKAIGARTVKLFKTRLMRIQGEVTE
jgi:hypothetical protein